MNRLNKGFTLMELLIVIGVLGILAAGLLAAIDPFEQLKKARDTNNRSAATEMLSASQRYYATHGYLPWFKPGASAGTFDTNCPNADWSAIRPTTPDVSYTSPGREAVKVSVDITSGGVYSCLTNTLGTDGEIKATFFNGLKTPIYIMSGSPTSSAVCFAPEGRSNLSDPQTKYLFDVTSNTITIPATGCTDSQKSGGLCLQCFE